jgi:inosose dehydratase
MPQLPIGCGQITWPRTTPEDQILAEIARAGYDGAPGDARTPGQTAQDLLDLFARHGLRPAPGYLGGQFWDHDQADALVQAAADKARLMRELGCTELYVSANLTPERRAVAGHVGPADLLDATGFATFAATLNRVGEATLREGVRTCYHNHVGSYIETREEVDRLFDLVDRSLVFLGPDTGHLAWGGADVVQFCRDYADSIETIHIKDIDPRVRATGVAAGWDYATFAANGIFTEIGNGLVDFPAVFAILNAADFGGWVIVETDVTRQPTPLASATLSRTNLRRLGL